MHHACSRLLTRARSSVPRARAPRLPRPIRSISTLTCVPRRRDTHEDVASVRRVLRNDELARKVDARDVFHRCALRAGTHCVELRRGPCRTVGCHPRRHGIRNFWVQTCDEQTRIHMNVCGQPSEAGGGADTGHCRPRRGSRCGTQLTHNSASGCRACAGRSHLVHPRVFHPRVDVARRIVGSQERRLILAHALSSIAHALSSSDKGAAAMGHADEILGGRRRGVHTKEGHKSSKV